MTPLEPKLVLNTGQKIEMLKFLLTSKLPISLFLIENIHPINICGKEFFKVKKVAYRIRTFQVANVKK